MYEAAIVTGTSWVLLTTAACLLFCLWKSVFYQSKKFKDMVEGIPGPKKLPIIGDGHLFLGAGRFEILHILNNLCTQYKPVAGLWLGPTFYALIGKAEDAEVIMNGKYDTVKSDYYRVFHKVCTGLVTNGGERWKKSRKLLNPMFQSQAMPNYVKTFSSVADGICEMLESKVGKPDFDIYPYFERAMYRVFSSTVVAKEIIPSFAEYEHRTIATLKDGSAEVFSMSFLPWYSNDFIFRILPRCRELVHRLDVMKAVIKLAIDKTREIVQRNPPSKIKDGLSFGEYILSMEGIGENQLSTKVVHEEITTLIVASWETTTSAIGFVTYLISKYPDVQEKLVQEIVQEFGSLDNTELTPESLNRLKYLDQVIKESMRCYAPLPFIGRALLEDIPLPSGYTLPKGSNVIISLYNIHRDPDMFPNPDVFNPDNFSDENVASRPAFATMPFSWGPRNCIGFKYALLNMKTHIVTILRKFELTSSPQYEPILMVSFGLHSDNGIHVGLKRRSLT